MWQQIKRRYIKRPLRKLARALLGYVSRLTLLKHRSTVIVLIGSGSTSIVREAIYSVVKEVQSARRNIESPEAEFSIPLTVLGYKNYPDNYRTWLWYLIKAYLQLFTVRPLKHTLVLELNPVQQSTMDYWMDVLKPKIGLQIGNTSFQIHQDKLEYFRSYQASADSLVPYKDIATQLGEYLKIDPLDIELGLNSMRFPEARIRFLQGENSSLIVDATHYYFPIKLPSVLELISPEDQNLIAFTPFELDQVYLKQAGWSVNPQNYIPKNHDLILLRGKRSELINKHGRLINTLKENK